MQSCTNAWFLILTSGLWFPLKVIKGETVMREKSFDSNKKFDWRKRQSIRIWWFQLEFVEIFHKIFRRYRPLAPEPNQSEAKEWKPEPVCVRCECQLDNKSMFPHKISLYFCTFVWQHKRVRARSNNRAACRKFFETVISQNVLGSGLSDSHK